MPELEGLPFDNTVSAKYENCKKQITDINSHYISKIYVAVINIKSFQQISSRYIK